MGGIDLTQELITYSQINSEGRLLGGDTINHSKTEERGISDFTKKTFEEEPIVTGTKGWCLVLPPNLDQLLDFIDLN